jgi:FkbM family methyltransferase
VTDWLKQLLSEAGSKERINTDWLTGSCPIFIHGTGSMARDIQSVLVNHGLPVFGFIDHLDPATSPVDGVPVYKPETARAAVAEPRTAVVVLGIHNRLANLTAIIQLLKACGFERVIYPVELYDTFEADLGSRYWLTRRDFYPSHESALEETLTLWADETSRTIFRSILEFRLKGDPGLLPSPDLTNQYHPLDLPAWVAPLRLVDCGSFDGDTIADLIKNKFQIEALAAFEPDQVNFTKLSRFVYSQLENLPDAQLWPCGVYSSNVQLTFDAEKGEASSITNTGDAVIQCVALDDALPTFAPTLIKMVIEGAEYEALRGAQRLIANHLPGLAISVYHHPEHLWQIPLWVNQSFPGKYQLYLRSHAYNDFDLVLYAIPTKGSSHASL